MLFKGDIQVCERDGIPPPLAQAQKLAHSAAKGPGTLQAYPSFVWSILENNALEDIKIN